jgi:FAD/FMN-containing dehydrogenase
LTAEPPKFKGEVFIRSDGPSDSAYNLRAYQYATSSNPGKGGPDMIVYAKNEPTHSDIRAAIQYAKANNISVAVRSGGHQYLGFSSTTGRNIQLDMSEYNQSDFNSDKKQPTLTLGVAWRIKEINELCKKLKVFYAHG